MVSSIATLSEQYKHLTQHFVLGNPQTEAPLKITSGQQMKTTYLQLIQIIYLLLTLAKILGKQFLKACVVLRDDNGLTIKQGRMLSVRCFLINAHLQIFTDFLNCFKFTFIRWRKKQFAVIINLSISIAMKNGCRNAKQLDLRMLGSTSDVT